MKNKITIIILFVSLNIFADTLILNTGEYFQGKTISQNTKEIIFYGEDKKNNSYPKTQVLRVFYRDMSEAEVQAVIDKEFKDSTKKIKAKKFSLEDDSYKGNRWSPVWRSAILPGWGQWYGKQKVLGMSFGLLFLGSLSFLGSSYQTMNDNLDKREEASRNGNLALILQPPSLSNFTVLYITNQIYASQATQAEKDYQESLGTVVIAGGLVGFIYTVQIIHSIYLGNKLIKERDARIKKLNETGFKFDSKIERIQGIDNNQINQTVSFQYSIPFE